MHAGGGSWSPRLRFAERIPPGHEGHLSTHSLALTLAGTLTLALTLTLVHALTRTLTLLTPTHTLTLLHSHTHPLLVDR